MLYCRLFASRSTDDILYVCLPHAKVEIFRIQCAIDEDGHRVGHNPKSSIGIDLF